MHKRPTSSREIKYPFLIIIQVVQPNFHTEHSHDLLFLWAIRNKGKYFLFSFIQKQIGSVSRIEEQVQNMASI